MLSPDVLTIQEKENTLNIQKGGMPHTCENRCRKKKHRSHCFDRDWCQSQFASHNQID